MQYASEVETARRLLQQRRPTEAWLALEPLLAKSPDGVDALLLAGRIHLALDDATSGRRYLSEAARLAPGRYETQFLYGFALYIDNDFALAVAPLERALKLKPKDGAALLYLAMTHDGLAQTEEALRLYPQAVERSAGAEARLAYGRFLMNLQRLDEAQQQVTAALALDPKSREAHYEQARLFAERGRDAQAAASGELALQLGGAEATQRALHHLLARTYLKLKQVDRAREHRQAFERIPARLVR